MKKFILTAILTPTLGVAVLATPALASGNHRQRNSNDTTVTTNNSAYVSNVVAVSGNTGGNTADGGNGGNGSNGGNGGDGGAIMTGSVLAAADVLNKVNKIKTTVGCGCEDDGDVTVTTNNSAKIKNTVAVSGNTGGNVANGGSGGSGSNPPRHHHGSGGNGGAGGLGGAIVTGDTVLAASVANYINSTITSL
jgi:hypothetical protein